MKLTTTIRNTIATAALVMMSSVSGWASPVEITIVSSGVATPPGFGYSVIHSATNQSGAHHGYYTGGSILYNNISGTLFGDLVQDGLGYWNLSSISGSLMANIVAGGTASLTITTGMLNEQVSGLVDGSLAYTVGSGPGAGSGTFYFDAIDFMSHASGPNRLGPSSFVLWGNNWDYQGGASKPSSGGLGIDLVGTIQPVPEPGTLLLLGTGLAAMVGWRRRIQS